MSVLLPIFPLSLVLLPGMSVPLHIFEDRYKEMMGELIPAGGEFGIVLAKDNGIVNIGCTATVDQVVQRYPDGRLDVMTTGRRRFRIEDLDEEKAYLRAEVEFFDDEDLTEISPDLRQKASEAYQQLKELEGSKEPRKEGSRLSFQLAQLISDLDKRQT